MFHINQNNGYGIRGFIAAKQNVLNTANGLLKHAVPFKLIFKRLVHRTKTVYVKKYSCRVKAKYLRG